MFDLVIKNGRVCDGTGTPSYLADIGVTGDRITRIRRREDGDTGTLTAKTVIDAEGMVITPGFIDPHTHVDLSVLMQPAMEPYLRQGVTTVVTGNCGYSIAPQGEETLYFSDMDMEFLEKAGALEEDLNPLIFDRDKGAAALAGRYGVTLDWQSFDQFNEKCGALPLGCNMAPLIGYSAVRTAVMGKDCLRSASEEELTLMEQQVRRAMKEGAFGLSTGRDPVYLPGPYADDGEMRRMLRVVSEYGGIFSSHTFNYSSAGQPDRFGGYREMLRQADGIPLRLNISHVHVMNMAETEREAAEAAQRTLAYFEEMREQGVDLTYDVIPSPSCSDFTQTSFGYFLKPLVLLSGSRKQLAEDFRRPAFRRRVHEMIDAGSLPILDADSELCWLQEFVVLRHQNASFVGKSMTECAKRLSMGLADTVMTLFAEDPDMVCDMIAPDFSDAVDILCGCEYAMPCSDGSSYSKETNLTGNDEMPLYPNSMNIGYIPRYLNRYGKDHLERAVRQASGFVAERFQIKERGIIKEGYFADLAILDLARLRSFDEEENPLRDPEGIKGVVVNGRLVLQDGMLTGAAAGKVLRRPTI